MAERMHKTEDGGYIIRDVPNETKATGHARKLRSLGFESLVCGRLNPPLRVVIGEKVPGGEKFSNADARQYAEDHGIEFDG